MDGRAAIHIIGVIGGWRLHKAPALTPRTGLWVIQPLSGRGGTERGRMRYIEQVEELRVLLEDADYVGVKTVEGDVTLQEFLKGMFAYRPGLIRSLYRVRSGLVRLLGIRQQPLPEMDEWIPSEVPMLACGNIWFFSVSLAREDRYWIGSCPEESHLTAFMGVVVEPLPGTRTRFHFVTIVRYKRWTGRLYFLLIRPFNRFFVNRLARAGLAGINVRATGS